MALTAVIFKINNNRKIQNFCQLVWYCAYALGAVHTLHYH